jgi:hypothetical protein
MPLDCHLWQIVLKSKGPKNVSAPSIQQALILVMFIKISVEFMPIPYGKVYSNLSAPFSSVLPCMKKIIW